MSKRVAVGAIRWTLWLACSVAAAGAWARGASAQTASVQTASAQPAVTALVAVTGTVYDSVARAPLAGAQVQLVDAANQARVVNAVADSTGTFHLAIAPGTYVAGFFHSAVDALGIESPLAVIVIPAAPAATIALAIPGPASIATAICGPRAPHDSSGILVGRVRDADTDAAVAGARVVVSWFEIDIGAGGIQQQHRRVPVQTRDDGGYAICGLPDDRIIASADSGARKSGLIEIAIPTRGLVRRDFLVANPGAAVATRVDSAPGAPATTVLRGAARLAGTVLRPNGQPVGGARVTVWGSGLSATTGADGHFTLSGLPAGTFSVQARAIGFAPSTNSVDLTSNRTASVTIALSDQTTTLAPVTVYGKASNGVRDMNAFLERKRQGLGHFLTVSDLQNRFAVTDALRMVPGIHVTPTGTGEAVYGRGGCIPGVYVDGMTVPGDPASVGIGGTTTGGNPPDIDAYVQPSQIMGIEVYTDIGGIPPQYQSNGCGVILIWTRR